MGAVLFPGVALAQTPDRWAPPDRALWDIMIRAIDEVPMSKGSHARIDQIIDGVQREAITREIQAKAKEKEKTEAKP